MSDRHPAQVHVEIKRHAETGQVEMRLRLACATCGVTTFSLPAAHALSIAAALATVGHTMGWPAPEAFGELASLRGINPTDEEMLAGAAQLGAGWAATDDKGKH